jgi:plastocyanin
MLSNAILLGASLSALASAAVVKVSVGPGDVFTPSTITADVGDTVEFDFEGVLHDVTQSSANSPCSYEANGFWSTQLSDKSAKFTITIDNKDPKYFFCSVLNHCSLGMVGIINP